MLHFSVFRLLAYLLLAVFVTPAYAAPRKKPVKPEAVNLDEEESQEAPKKQEAKKEQAPKKEAPKPAAPKAVPKPPPKVETVDEEEDEGEGEAEGGDGEDGAGQQTAGLECTPAVSEIETRRPIPISCTPTKKGIERVEVRYRAPARKKWTKLYLRKSGADFVGDIPCTITAKRGILKVSIVGFSLQGKELARIGGVELNLVDASNEPPPSLPGKEPPMRCYDPGDCPNELKGSPACPGTKAVAGAKTWGAACTASADCQKGLVCMSGTCEQPPKCDSGAECASGECANGVCVVSDPGEPSKTIGPPKYNWIGLHLALDSMFVRDAVGVCGNTTDDAGDYSCFEGGNEYKGQPNRANAGNVKSGFRFGTIRALLSYERWYGRLAAGARLGFAIRGAPKGFMPVHAELRLLYSMRPDPLSKRIRPYAGLFAGLMEVQASSRATVIDCIEESLVARQACVEQADSRTLTTTQAAIRRFDAFRDGSSFGFGPTLGLYTALANDSALNFNLNLVLPDMAFQLSAGYLMGI